MSYLSQKKASLWLAGFVLATFLTSIVCPPGVWAQPKAAAEVNRTRCLGFRSGSGNNNEVAARPGCLACSVFHV